jgi:phosphonate transport system ATP-binding protein
MKITILINIHHVDLALDYADRVIGIRAGEIVYDGSVKDVTQDVLDIIYNGAPVPKAADEQNAMEAALIAETKAKADAKQGAAIKEAQL